MAFCLGVALSYGCSGGSGDSGAGSDSGGNVDLVKRSLSKSMGEFRLEFDEGHLQVYANDKVTWESVPGVSFIQGGIHELHAEEIRGSFTVEENLRHLCQQSGEMTARSAGQSLVISGELSGDPACETGFEVTFTELQAGHLGFEVSFSNPLVNYSRLVYESVADERFHGFGEQFSVLDMKGQRLPILSEEGGVGRGHAVISFPVDLASPGSAGGPLTTYYASPQYISSRNRGFLLENTDYAIFDLTAADQVQVNLFNGNMRGRIFAGNSMLEQIERVTEYTGRMRPLPDWFNEGAVVGMQGGTAKVTEVLEELKRRGTPIAGFWLQDWVGKRQTAFGSQLWWNWELDRDRYPDWDGLVDAIEAEGGRMLCYINPFLVDATPKGNVRRNLYQEALDNGYMVKKSNGSVYEVTNTDFDAGMVDLTNPSAVNWMKQIIKDQLISEGRCHGWMHDFAEALPFDAVLFSGESAATYHNQYTVDWARLAREAIEEVGLGDEIVFFNRSGAARTPEYSTLLWQGDQLVTWDKYDGMKTSIMALLTGGFSGISLNHSDIGGYTNASFGGVGYDREKELLMRWMELSAFTAAYRTHEGLKPEDNAQFYDDDETYSQFDRFARVYKALAFYRKELFREASEKGYPVVRHPMLHFPEDPVIPGLKDHMMLGDEILFAPIINKKMYNNDWKKVYFPDGENTTWVHAFTGETYGKTRTTTPPGWLQSLNPARGNWEWVYAPMGTPAVFYRQGSTVGEQFELNLQTLGVKP